MSTKRILWTLIATLAGLVSAPWAEAQYGVRNDHRGGTWPSDDPPFIEYDPFIEATPFVDPGYFDYDLQPFAPADVGEFGGPPDPRTGWYFDYQRLYLSTSTPRQGVNPNWQSYSWGNRFQIGYYTANQTGWMADYTHFIVSGGTSYIPPDLDSVFPASVKSEENVGELHRFDLCKSYRLDQFEGGGTIEMFFGGGYTGFTDRSFAATDLFESDGATPPTLTGEVYFNQPLTDPQTHNRIPHIILGTRARTQTGRWSLTGEARMLAGVNFQHYSPYIRNTAVSNDGTVVVFNQTFVNAQTRDEFVVGGDLRADALLQLTRDIAIQVGFTMTYYGTGVARYGNPAFNNEDLLMAGASFGFVVNR